MFTNVYQQSAFIDSHQQLLLLAFIGNCQQFSAIINNQYLSAFIAITSRWKQLLAIVDLYQQLSHQQCLSSFISMIGIMGSMCIYPYLSAFIRDYRHSSAFISAIIGLYCQHQLLSAFINIFQQLSAFIATCQHLEQLWTINCSYQHGLTFVSNDHHWSVLLRVDQFLATFISNYQQLSIVISIYQHFSTVSEVIGIDLCGSAFIALISMYHICQQLSAVICSYKHLWASINISLQLSAWSNIYRI